jgi:uncharacterized membrane protein YidH (DUF202 family)
MSSEILPLVQIDQPPGIFCVILNALGHDCSASRTHVKGGHAVETALLAAERTLLAWVRTIVTAIGFGMLLARFYTRDRRQGQFVLFAVTFVSGMLIALAYGRYLETCTMLLTTEGYTPDIVGPTLCAACVVAMGAVFFGTIIADYAREFCAFDVTRCRKVARGERHSPGRPSLLDAVTSASVNVEGPTAR